MVCHGRLRLRTLAACAAMLLAGQAAWGQEKHRLNADGFTVVVMESGGLRIDIRDESYGISSAFSYAGQSLGYHRFDIDTSETQGQWTPVLAKTDSRTVEIQADSKQYRLERTLRLDGERLRVRDRFVNKTSEPIGILICNSVSIAADLPPEKFYLAGQEGFSAATSGSAENPTAFAAQQRSSIGVVAEDNVYCLGLYMIRRGGTVELKTDHFGLDGEQAYTLEWTVYPRPHCDYWAFINEVRRDWNVNFTILGPFAFGQGHNRLKSRLMTIGSWLDYADGAALSRAEYKATWSQEVAALRRSDPDITVMALIETNLVTFNKRRIPGGEILPCSTRLEQGIYGLALTRPQSDVLETLPYADSSLRTADGRFIIDTHYAKEPDFNLLVYPVKGNHRYQTFFDQIDFVMDQVGFNGVYIDQFSLGWGNHQRPDRCTFEKWDGRSVDVDMATGRVARKYTDCALVSATARAEILNYILSKGGKAVVNTHPCVRETQSLPVFRFVEMESDAVDLLSYMDGKPPMLPCHTKGHLSSPITLGVRPTRWGRPGMNRWAEMIHKAVICGLRDGLLYYCYAARIPQNGAGAGDYGVLNHMFPFTPVELHSGWLVGKERTITCISGTYRWEHAQAPECHRFDLHGREIPHEFSMVRQGDGWNVTIKLDDWNETAVLE